MSATKLELETSFYIIGGTVERDAPCYVERRADTDLYDGLQQGRFCYVLTSRQMGKSSLMVRTAARLREEDAGVMVLDLTAIGQNLSAEQWYDGLLMQIAQQLDLDDELEEFWSAHPKLGPLQRWMQAIRQVVLPHYPGRVVIFVDEIDAVRSLPFSTDEFFAGIREFYNRRAEDAALERLTFCLLGVATPSDLIRDTRTTPFNIGQRIELTDFTEAEAAPLIQGLGREEKVGKALLKRVLYWTGGHPYLTQQLCQAVAEDESAHDAKGVDRLCEELFLSHRAQERDDNLLFVRERILRSEVDLASLLDLYAQVRNGKRVADEITNPLVGVLRLSGITRVEGRYLRVRNHIYERVFDREWVKANMPDAEVRRQRAAYRRGLLRATAVATVVLVSIAALALMAVKQRHRAESEKLRADRNAEQWRQASDEARKQQQKAEEQSAKANAQQALAEAQSAAADEQRQRAEAGERSARLSLYAEQMKLAQESWDTGNPKRALDLLNQHVPKPGQADLRGFEWYHIWRLTHTGQLLLPTGESPRALATGPRGERLVFSPDGARLALVNTDYTVKVWEARSGRELITFPTHANQYVWCLAISHNGKMLATESDGQQVKLWDLATGREMTPPLADPLGAVKVAFTPDDRQLLVFSADLKKTSAFTRWDLASRRSIVTHQFEGVSTTATSIAPDFKLVARSYGRQVRLWDAQTGEEWPSFIAHADAIALAFSSESKFLAVGGNDNQVTVWDTAKLKATVASREALLTLKTQVNANLKSFALSFSPDSRRLIVIRQDRTMQLWDLPTGQEVSFEGSQTPAELVTFSPDGRQIASTNNDGFVKLWNVASEPEPIVLQGHEGLSLAFSPDGRLLADGQADGKNGHVIRLRELATGQELAALSGHSSSISAVAFSPDGKLLASGSVDRTIKLWDVKTRRELHTLRGHTGMIRGLAFSLDGKRLASVTGNAEIKFWDTATGQEVVWLKTTQLRVASVAYSPDRKLLATGAGFCTGDCPIKLWDAQTGRERATLKGHTGFVASVAFSPDSQRLVSASADQTIKVWDIATGKQLLPLLEGHTGGVSSAAFSPDGQRIASASVDGTVKLWEAATGRELVTYKEHKAISSLAGVMAVAFSPDGRWLASGDNRGGLVLRRAAMRQEASVH